MGNSTQNEALGFSHVQTVRCDMQTPDVVRFIIVDRIGLIHTCQAVQLDVGVADFIDVNHNSLLFGFSIK
ncbi:hypothetical protein D3C80_1835280 [compost metagenome]